jgi:hypothetical protein
LPDIDPQARKAGPAPTRMITYKSGDRLSEHAEAPIVRDRALVTHPPVRM